MKDGLQFSGRQSQGARDYQEDSWGWHNRRQEGDDSPSGLLVVLADGMGGHQGGAHASAVAVDTFIKTFSDSKESKDGVASRLKNALDQSNERIRVDSAADPKLNGMGCTLVAVNFGRDGMHWISVGDSPMWLYREGRMKRLNQDHSMAPLLQAQVDAGELTADDAARHPQRNALRSAVIGDKIEMVDLPDKPMRLQPGDRILLASDGIETLSEEDIGAIAGSDPDANSKNLAERLVAAVDERHQRGQDNTTVVVVSPYHGVRETTILVGRPGRQKKQRRSALTAMAVLAAAAVAGWYFLGRKTKLISSGGETAEPTSSKENYPD